MFNSKKNKSNEDSKGNLSAEEQANIDKGLNADGSTKTIELSQEQKDQNIAAGLNEDGSAKTPPVYVKPPSILEINTIAPESYAKSEMVINEIMVQKQCTREKAVEILSQTNK